MSIIIKPYFTSTRAIPSMSRSINCHYAPEGMSGSGGGKNISWETLRSRIINDEMASVYCNLYVSFRMEQRNIAVPKDDDKKKREWWSTLNASVI